MARRWNSDQELVDALAKRAVVGRTVTLSPETALRLVLMLRAGGTQERPVHGPGRIWRVDLFAEGSCIYRMFENGEVERIEAWARSTTVAHAIREELKAKYPEKAFSQRRRSWVEGE